MIASEFSAYPGSTPVRSYLLSTHNRLGDSGSLVCRTSNGKDTDITG